MNDILDGYVAAATPELIERYESFDPAELYAPVFDLLPEVPVRVADIGTGTGRDAAWFARRGHSVVAVEPVRELREAGVALHGAKGILWLDDTLPALTRLQPCGLFDLVTLNGVWHHIDDDARRIAMPILAQMMATGGRLVISLRHGPGAPGRRAFQAVPADTVDAAADAGLELLREAKRPSIQPGNKAMGVHWTWLVFQKVG